jgi:hypothetical protein
MQGLKDDGSTGLGQGSFDDQTLAANAKGVVAELVGQEQAPVVLGILADHLWLDGDAAFAPDSHAVQSKLDTSLSPVEVSGLHNGIVQGNVESGVEDDGAL